MNIRMRKIITYRLVATLLLCLSIGLSTFALVEAIKAKPEKVVLDIIALGLTISFAIGQIILICSGKKKESHLLDIAFNSDNTVNKLALVLVLVGTSFGVGLDILTIVVICTRSITLSVYCSMLIIMSIASYLLLNCITYIIFTLLFKKRELTLEDYAK